MIFQTRSLLMMKLGRKMCVLWVGWGGAGCMDDLFGKVLRKREETCALQSVLSLFLGI
jgi:hypothetical protein